MEGSTETARLGSKSDIQKIEGLNQVVSALEKYKIVGKLYKGQSGLEVRVCRAREREECSVDSREGCP